MTAGESGPLITPIQGRAFRDCEEMRGAVTLMRHSRGGSVISAWIACRLPRPAFGSFFSRRDMPRPASRKRMCFPRNSRDNGVGQRADHADVKLIYNDLTAREYVFNGVFIRVPHIHTHIFDIILIWNPVQVLLNRGIVSVWEHVYDCSFLNVADNAPRPFYDMYLIDPKPARCGNLILNIQFF